MFKNKIGKIKKVKLILLALIISSFFGITSQAQADWQGILEQYFDIVETFDELKDYPVSSGQADQIHTGYSGPNSTAILPKKLDGADSNITEIAWWADGNPPSTDWIADHSANGGHIWDPNGIGGKSIIWDMSHRQINGLGDGKQHGSNIISINWSNGDRHNGYTDFYFFYMAWYPVNYWPTEINNGIGEYDPNNTRQWVASTKTVVVTCGLNGLMRHADNNDNGWTGQYLMDRGDTYGWSSRVFHFKARGNETNDIYGVFQGHCKADDADPTPPWTDECLSHDNYNVWGGQ